MTYTLEFQNRIARRDIHQALELWKEFCEMDSIEKGELFSILEIIHNSDMAPQFGPYVELALPLLMSISEKDEQIKTLSLLYDLQTTNSQELWDLLQKLLKDEYGKDPLFSEKIRITGLRSKGNFQGALSNFLLLNHLAKGNFVYHKSGWGGGEILDCSFLREQISVEFENVAGSKKELPFKTAFKSVTPLPKDHFLALRFGSPETLEKQAHSDPVGLVTKILEELGPKSASEIKDLLSGYILDEGAYSKWWQLARAKLKKDPFIISPESPKDTFSIRQKQLTLTSRVDELFSSPSTCTNTIPALWSLLRDFPQVLKEAVSKNKIAAEIELLLKTPLLRPNEKAQLFFLSEIVSGPELHEQDLQKEILSLEKPIEEAVRIEIIAFRKQFLQAIKEYRKDWKDLFQLSLLELDSVQIKEYLYKELVAANCLNSLEQVFETLLEHPLSHPEGFLWAFQKSIEKESHILTSQRDQERFFESFLLLLAAIDNKPHKRELAKKMHAMLTGNRFKIVRDFFTYTDISFIQEFLLLASKCQTLSEHDVKILQSLAEVSHPDLSEKANDEQIDQNILWTTQEGYNTVQNRIKHIGTIEIIDNAKEIEAARALGDLRENAEYKFALERRSRLQAELKMLSDQFHRARVITKEDINTSSAGVGTKVTLKDASGKKQEYLLLGPWDANVEKNILSFQSKLAEAMLGKKVGDKVSLRGETFIVESIKSYFA